MTATLLSLILLGAEPAAVQTSATPTTRLFVETSPPGAKVKLDGQAKGSAPLLLHVPPQVGKIIVEVELDGHAGKRQEVEIRGGRVTRVEFRLEPTPPTARQEAVPGSTQPQASVEPPSEKSDRYYVLNSLLEHRGSEAIDLDAGRLLDLPRDLQEWPQRQGQDWVKKNRVDLLAVYSEQRWGLLAVDLRLRPMADYLIDTITLPQLRELLSGEPPGSAWRGIEIKDRDGARLYVFEPKALPPITFAFKTAEGTLGMLQIADFREDKGNHSMVVRCKILEKAAKNAAETKLAPTTPAPLTGKPEEVPPKPGTVVERILSYGNEFDEALDLNTGKVVTVSKSSFANTKSGLPQSLMDRGFHLGTRSISRPDWVLATANLTLLPAADNLWDAMTLPQLRELTFPETVSTPRRADGIRVPGIPGHFDYVLPPNIVPPVTFAFRIREGALGMLQVTKLERDSVSRIHLRYKILEEAPKKAAAETVPAPDRPVQQKTERKPVPMNERIERVLYNFDEDEGQQTLDLDTGVLLDLPQGFRQWPKAKREEWLTKNGVDLIAQFAGNRWSLGELDLTLRPLTEEQWDEIDRQGLRAALPILRERMNHPFRNMEIAGTYVTGGQRWWAFRPQPHLFALYAFKTREGSVGILNIFKLDSDTPHKIQLAYKLLGTVRAPTQAGAPAEESPKAAPPGKETGNGSAAASILLRVSGPKTATVWEEVTFTLQVWNKGSAAVPIRLTCRWDPAIVVGGATYGGDRRLDEEVIFWDLPALPPGEMASRQIICHGVKPARDAKIEVSASPQVPNARPVQQGHSLSIQEKNLTPAPEGQPR